MNETISAYIYDFLSMVFEEKGLIEKIKEIMVFGSVAKKTYDKKSDIDLFFNIKDKGEIVNVEDGLRRILKSFEVKAEKTWELKHIKLPINLIVGSLDDRTWENIREEIISSGVILYGPYKEMPKNVKHYSLFYYSLSDLSRKDKMKFIRRLFGYSLKRDRKEYKEVGLLEKINGLKLASNVILVPLEDLIEIKKVFSEFKISYKIMETWVRL